MTLQEYEKEAEPQKEDTWREMDDKLQGKEVWNKWEET